MNIENQQNVKNGSAKTADQSQDAVNAPSLSGQGNNEAMSQQMQQSMPSTDQVKGIWKQQVGAAKIAWGKLTEDELLKSEGHEQKLAGLVQERYAVTRDEADKQIKGFFDKHKPSRPGIDEIKAKWKQQVGAAKIAWGKLTEDELLKLEGHEQKLTGLVQERYAITRAEADKQVKDFFNKHKS